MTKYSVPTSEKLTPDNQEEFREFLIQQRELGMADRNADWFDYLLDKDFWKTYPNTPNTCLLYTSPSPRDRQKSRMPSSA